MTDVIGSYENNLLDAYKEKFIAERYGYQNY